MVCFDNPDQPAIVIHHWQCTQIVLIEELSYVGLVHFRGAGAHAGLFAGVDRRSPARGRLRDDVFAFGRSPASLTNCFSRCRAPRELGERVAPCRFQERPANSRTRFRELRKPAASKANPTVQAHL